MDAFHCEKTEAVDKETAENPDLEDGEIEDDDDEELPVEEPVVNDVKATPQILPAAVPTDVTLFTSPAGDKDKSKRHNSERKLTEAEKCVRMLHKMEREARERRERERRREQLKDDWAGNIEKAIASVLKKERHSASGEDDEEDDDKKRGRKRKKKERERKKKHRKTEQSPKEDFDEDEMLNVRGASPESKLQQQQQQQQQPQQQQQQKESSPFQDNEHGYESYDSENDSDPYNHRQTKRGFDRDRKRDRNRNREQRRDRKTFREKNSRKKEEQRPQLQDANSICMFYMQGKCHKGDECPYSHDALPPMKLELCKFYLMDCCAKRDKCLYMHSEFPCKYYHTGLKCFAKDTCKFAHGKPLSDSLKQVLLKHLETAPKEILGEFPRLSREGAQHMVNETQKNLEVQYGIKNPQPPTQTDKTAIPSLFDITIPMPPELMNQSSDDKPKSSETPAPKEKKVRQTRWNDEPPVPVTIPMLNPAFAGNIGVQNMFPQLNLQDQQKLQEYQMNFQMKGFYSEQDQDMRINTNGDVDMRTLPQIIQKPPETQLNFEQYRQDANLTSQISDSKNLELSKMDVDIRNFGGSECSLHIVEENPSNSASKTDLTSSNSSTSLKKDNYDIASDSSVHKSDNDLTIDEKPSDINIPSSLPKKQRELFLRIQAQQKENPPEKEENNEVSINNDEDWYSSDDENDPLSKMVIHLEDEENPIRIEEDDVEEKKVFSPPMITMKPVEVFDKLGDLSKIDISDEVTKLLQTMKGNNTTSSVSPTSEPKKSRDPRQAKLLENEITSPNTSTNSHLDPRMISRASSNPSTISSSTSSSSSSSSTTTSKPERRLSTSQRVTIYEQGIINPEEKKSIFEHAGKAGIDLGKSDVDLRNLNDLDMRQNFGDTDLRQQMLGRQDVDLRQLGLPFKAMQNYTPATEIDASIGSHSQMSYKVHVVDIPRPDYTGLKLTPQDPQVKSDPRLRKIFRIPSVEERDSPASPKPTVTSPKPARQDPRRRNVPSEPEIPQNKPDTANMTYNQQLQLLQNSVFYQSLTSNQKLMLNQEIASKGDQNTKKDAILSNILSSLGIIKKLNDTSGYAMDILNNINSLVPNINPILGPMNPPNVGMPQMPLAPNLMPQNMPIGLNMNQNVPNPGITPNLGPGLLGAAPGLGLGPPNIPQNEFPINFDPRNGGLLGPAPFQNFQENQNFQYNDEFYPNNEENCNFSGHNFPREPNQPPPQQQQQQQQRNNFRIDRNMNNRRGGRNYNRNNNRNFNRNNNTNHRNRDRTNRSYTPP